MRLPRFDYLEPANLEEALDLLATHGDDAKILAGGTDLLVRMKKGLLKPKNLISLKALNELSYIKEDDGYIKIGARTPLADIIASELIQNKARALFQACEEIGAITIQHYRGTIGGNILQDNRCQHYNQSNFHRSGRQACHKDGGKICYARDEGDRCYSTCQSDGATALMSLGAQITLAKKGDERTVDLADFYTTDGIMPFAMESHELLKKIAIPVHGPMQGAKSAYKRLAYRSAIDYPIVCAGVLLKPSDTQKNEIDEARIVVGSMSRSPLFLAQESSSLKGKKLDDTDAFKKAADASMNSAATFAVHNVGSTLEYRCAMVSEMVFQALKESAQAAIAAKG
ncbi:MAG: FAD binding domain-containing protein [Desulfobacula sp.]|uniref:FAD binding domain-containing protein n=1 Tax=Desulfobacula sp. TaxID=2593537 RepID=UPI0025B82C7D|nr:FAD binding domain-containing protein [Desulfobacula sp.]MCD4721523.1 FAD binding domain-containing protein [Desulfobacula sp.]